MEETKYGQVLDVITLSVLLDPHPSRDARAMRSDRSKEKGRLCLRLDVLKWPQPAGLPAVPRMDDAL